MIRSHGTETCAGPLVGQGRRLVGSGVGIGPTFLSGQDGHRGDRLHPRGCSHFIHEAAQEGHPILAFRIGRSSHGHFDGEQFIGIDAGIDFLHRCKALDQEGGSDQEDQGERNLEDRESIANVVV